MPRTRTNTNDAPKALEAEVDLTPRPNIRLQAGAKPFQPGKIAGGLKAEIVIPDEASQLAGWYTPNAGVLYDMWRNRLVRVVYDRKTGTEIVKKDCANC